MLKTEQLAIYLKQYLALALHNDPSLKHMTLDVMTWQKQRLKGIHPNIFDQPQFAEMQNFFFNYFYDFNALELLAQQLQQALNERIKLDRWLPNDILDTLLNGFQLALITLESDSKIAQALLANNLKVETPNILTIFHKTQQTSIRQQQLVLLKGVTDKLLKFSQSFLVRSALRFARPKIEQRGFSRLNQYLDDSLKVMRTHKKQNFFALLTYQEKIFLEYLSHHQLLHLDVYYDVNTHNIRPKP